MKKFLIIMLIIFSSINITNANSCLIEYEESKELNNYLKNYRKILDNLYSQAKQEKKDEKPYSGLYNFGLKLYNDVFDFKNIKEEINFFSYYLKFQEVPKQVERDFKKLSLEDNLVKELSIFLTKYGLDEVPGKDICNGVKNCNISEKTLGNILIEVKKNNEDIKSAFIKTTAGLKDFNTKNFILISPNFFDDIETNYGKEGLSNCSKEKGFFEKISKSTEKIFNNENSAREGIKKWKEAWALVNGISTKNKEEIEAIERALLKKELERQGVSGDSQMNLLNNLDKYNKNGGFSKNNNFISNTYNQIINKFKNEYQELKQETIEDFWINYNEKSKGKNITVKESIDSKNNSDKSKIIKARIDNLYIENKDYTAISELNNENLSNRIINSHIELSNTINTLNETCKMAVRICNQQDAGNGNCGDCNW